MPVNIEHLSEQSSVQVWRWTPKTLSIGVHFQACTLPGDESLDTLADVHTIPAVLVIQPIIHIKMFILCLPTYFPHQF